MLALSLWCCMLQCLTGPSPNTPGFPTRCLNFDGDHDGDVDLKDTAMFLNSADEMDREDYMAIGVR